MATTMTPKLQHHCVAVSLRSLFLSILLLSSVVAAVAAAPPLTPPGEVVDLTPDLYDQLSTRNNKQVEQHTVHHSPNTAAAAADHTTNDRSRFFVKIDTRKCQDHSQNVCAIILETVWKPLATMYPAEIFVTLDCASYTTLCYAITSSKYVSALEGIAPFELLIVEFQNNVNVTTNNGSTATTAINLHNTQRHVQHQQQQQRAIEFYRGQRDIEASFLYYSEFIKRNQPLLPDIVSSLDANNSNNNNNGDDKNDDDTNHDVVLAEHHNNDNNNGEGTQHSNDGSTTTTTGSGTCSTCSISTARRRLVVLVLSTDGLVRPEIWTQFVNNTNDSDNGNGNGNTNNDDTVDVQMYIHDDTTGIDHFNHIINDNMNTNMKIKNNYNNNKNNNNNNDDDHQNTNNKNIPDFCHVIPTVYTNNNHNRLTISSVRAVIQLLRYATSNHNMNSSNQEETETHYILVSGDSIPLLNAQDIFHELSSSSTRSSSSRSTGTNTSTSRFEKHPNSDHTPYIFRYGYNIANPNIGYGTGNIVFGGTFMQPSDNYGYKKVFKSKLWFTMTHQDAVWFAHPAHDETDNFEMMIHADVYYFATLAHEYATATATTGTTTSTHTTTNNNHDKEQRPGRFETDSHVMYENKKQDEEEEEEILQSIDDAIHNNYGYLFARTVTKNTNVVLSWLRNNNNNNNNKKSNNYNTPKIKVQEITSSGKIISNTNDNDNEQQPSIVNFQLKANLTKNAALSK